MAEQDSFSFGDVVALAEAASIEAATFPDVPSADPVVRSLFDGLAVDPDKVPIETRENLQDIVEDYGAKIRDHMAQVIVAGISTTAVLESAAMEDEMDLGDEEATVLDAVDLFKQETGDETE